MLSILDVLSVIIKDIYTRSITSGSNNNTNNNVNVGTLGVSDIAIKVMCQSLKEIDLILVILK